MLWVLLLPRLSHLSNAEQLQVAAGLQQVAPWSSMHACMACQDDMQHAWHISWELHSAHLQPTASEVTAHSLRLC
jgi:hypothetical protein